MTRLNKILIVERDGDTLILVPRDKEGQFRMVDLHTESNAVRRLLDEPGVSNLVIDFGNLNYAGSEFIGTLVGLLRHANYGGGKAAMCNASGGVLDMVNRMHLAGIAPYFTTRDEALESLRS